MQFHHASQIEMGQHDTFWGSGCSAEISDWSRKIRLAKLPRIGENDKVIVDIDFRLWNSSDWGRSDRVPGNSIRAISSTTDHDNCLVKL